MPEVLLQFTASKLQPAALTARCWVRRAQQQQAANRRNHREELDADALAWHSKQGSAMAGLAAADDAGAGAPAGASSPAAALGGTANGAGPAKPVTRSSSKRSRRALEGAEASAAAAVVDAPASRRRQRRTAGKGAAEPDAKAAAAGGAVEAPAARRRRRAAKQAAPAGEDGDTDVAQERAAGEADGEALRQAEGATGGAGSDGELGPDAEEQPGGEEEDSEGLPELDAFDAGMRSAVEAFAAAATPAALLRPSPDLAALARRVAKARHLAASACLTAWPRSTGPSLRCAGLRALRT